ncbi:MAG: GNAT family N-acetyltransferase [Dehalococcoidia bacterium]|jgi:GNAT superfamily N-acetyltransferase|uniref:GNAT family N-acetyltransferase n=1 Tax=Candidatus Amarobacter glycogenicus TaxID=3140699 RepID=UPI001DD11522|nr:GNAT family N-acetyltransferase [Dehalococcoidia bacterium]MBK7124473.1 GNAT family N-acetyltransferase [Dehalococcoidia bacterium]MBK7328174.1 GNAT family N-acetyltransferase [Dehalococcoidia bacterium]MBK7724773.1 GNAT family N-acetyltransferase [Dehalococcoidia bacterium]MBK8560521.1 GNAT family N-acetyltransferase [Dehalococcoidia bacterium]
MRAKPPGEKIGMLRDGREVRIRPIAPEDAGHLMEFHSRLSVNTTRLRFFTPLRRLSPEFAHHLCTVDFKKRCAFVVCLPGEDEIRGVGRFEAESRRSAEVAFVVEDAMQGLGMGKLLLDRLVEQARRCGYERLTAVVLCENDSMLTLFRDSAFSPEITVEGDQAFVKMDIGGTTLGAAAR